ncbi:unnamed protein product [Rotaria sp. Silwood1]|nr:unnamed protein product [Rotaria sp. Silwood1]CAF1643871.1 unnamed protein product [Rotaria sp. Silwood1]CAF3737716.1 unnamed protein product [Rotaria sp. Silwood1]CAF3784538.1 unnamed protein product [Rotaria sp. Silwood1]CAF3835666.1 unnamed protein product [Rotaria sp. Silwood1]
MSTDDDISAVSDVENAKISDGTSTAGEHNTDKVNDAKVEEQSDVNSRIEEENQPDDEIKRENNKRDIDEIEKNGSKEEEGQSAVENEQDETVESISTNKKIKIIDTTTDENNETDSELPKEELTVV